MFSWVLGRARDYFTCDIETDTIAASRPSKFLNQLYVEVVEPSMLKAAHHKSISHKSISLEAPDEHDRKWVESCPQISPSDGTLSLDAPDELDRGLLKALVQTNQRNSNWQLHVKMEQWQRGRQELRQQKRHEQWTTVVLERKAALRSLANGVRRDIAQYVAIMRFHVGDAAYRRSLRDNAVYLKCAVWNLYLVAGRSIPDAHAADGRAEALLKKNAESHRNCLTWAVIYHQYQFIG